MSILLLLYGIQTPDAQVTPPPAVVSVSGGAGGVFTRGRAHMPAVIRADRKWLEAEDEDVLLGLE